MKPREGLASTVLVVGQAPSEKYELREKLGEGGMGEVVLALDRDVGREVALKMMLGGAAGEEETQRFLLEGRVTGRLEHPNIVPVYELGVFPDRQEKGPADRGSLFGAKPSAGPPFRRWDRHQPGHGSIPADSG